MTPEFVDASVFIRYLTSDNPDHSLRARAYLEDLEAGRVSSITREGVLVEVVFVLASKQLYNLPRATIADALGGIILLPGLHLPNKSVYIRALELYAQKNLDFVDALNVAHMEHERVRTIVSFDRGYDLVESVRRREP
jgi:predicted nucleic acid-binding protein